MQIAKNDVLSFYIATQESTKAHGFHALGAGGREFESRHSDKRKNREELQEHLRFLRFLFCIFA